MMKKAILSLLAVLLTGTLSAQDNLKLWYETPAATWNEALPIGNGSLGAMIYGTPGREVLQLNEETVWAGSPHNNYNTAAKDHLAEIRELIFQKKFKQAELLCNRYIASQTDNGMSYQTVGNLHLEMEGNAVYTDYYRDLDLATATATVSYTSNGVKYKREIFASHPDGVIVMRLTADKPGSVTFRAGFDSPMAVLLNLLGNNTLLINGMSTSQEGVKGDVGFVGYARVLNEGGRLAARGSSIEVTSADAVTILIAVGTNFKSYNDLSALPGDAEKTLDRASAKSYNDLKNSHIDDYRALFDRVTLDLGTTRAAQKPTDRRIEQFSQGNDPQLVALYFQFGRYLMISGSRPGTQAMNLQGIWNHHLAAPWDGKYTININTEMNYWPAEVTNLSDLHEPLFSLVRDLSVTGAEAAKNMYGVRGWVAHHNSDIWRFSGAIDRGFYGTWPMGGAWLSTHLWQHYLYTGDLNFLRQHYPVLKGLSEFYLDFLVKDPEHGWLVVAPSISPENTLKGFGDENSSVTAGTTMDNQIVTDVFDMTTKAAEALGLTSSEKEFLKQIAATRAKLPPMQVGRYGQLQEWMWDIDDPNDKHRHVSHLYGMFPSAQISPYRNPELFSAAAKTLEQRGDVSTGWSMGWKVCLWARLLDGDHALKLITDQLNLIRTTGNTGSGGTYANMFDAHPPFQIDGNFGCTAGIAEMFVQSHDGMLHILPALPANWKSGRVTGLKARGGFEVDIAWADGKLTRLVVRSALGGNCRIRVHTPVAGEGITLKKANGKNPNPYNYEVAIRKPLVSKTAPAANVRLQPSEVFDFATEAGESYSFTGK
ncbi:MAG: glycoside hydrolase family 95 protein [Rikenellaceae bacterium]|jgi:alpha-L-fucosidase 2|nr:glycoside hydrolase family 95 protein [Rikenellaceae bacterium]